MATTPGGLHVPDEDPPVDGAHLLGEEAEMAKLMALRRAGVICSACSLPIDEGGWEYISIRPEVIEGQPTIVSGRAYICSRAECAPARAALEKSAAARRAWAPYHVFEDEPAPAEPAAETPPQS